MSNQPAKSEWEDNSANNSVRVLYWSGAWVASTAMAAFGPKLIWNFHTD